MYISGSRQHSFTKGAEPAWLCSRQKSTKVRAKRIYGVRFVFLCYTITQMWAVQHSCLGTRKTRQVSIPAENLNHRTVSMRGCTSWNHVTILKEVVCSGSFNLVNYECSRKQTCKCDHLRSTSSKKEHGLKQFLERKFKHSWQRKAAIGELCGLCAPQKPRRRGSI